MFRHPDASFRNAIVNGLTASREAFEIGRVKAEKVGVVGTLDYYRVLELWHVLSLSDTCGLQNRLTGSSGYLFTTMIVDPNKLVMIRFSVVADRTFLLKQAEPVILE